MNELNFYGIDLKYIRNLSKTDDNVMSVSPQIGKENRPFVGVVVLQNGKNYCIPLTSPKNKFRTMKSQIDFIKVYDLKQKDNSNNQKLIGVLNINNMIPVDNSVIFKMNLSVYNTDNAQTRHYKELMQNQLKWCRKNYDVILNRANKVYRLVTETPDKNKNPVRRSCNFKKLEKVLKKFTAK